MEKDIRQSLQEHIFRLENRRRELMRPEYLRLGLTIGQGQPRILMYLLTEDGCSQREIAENCHLDVTTLSRTLDRLAEKGLLERSASGCGTGLSWTCHDLSGKDRTGLLCYQPDRAFLSKDGYRI